MVVLLLLLSPVLVELVDFHGGVALLKQVKRLQVATQFMIQIQKNLNSKTNNPPDRQTYDLPCRLH